MKTIMNFNEKAAEIIFSNSKDTIFLLYDDNSDNTKHFKNILELASHQLKGKILFSECIITHELCSRLKEYLGVGEKRFPLIIMLTFDDEDVHKFLMESDAITENLILFYNDVNSGGIQEYLKSEEIPNFENKSIRIVVGKTFN
jgi:hypothetical protein